MIDLNSATQSTSRIVPKTGKDRRQYERQLLTEATGELIYKGTVYPSEIIDVSIGGCCLRTAKRFPPGALANVEVILPLFGMTLRIVGTTQWLDAHNQIGIRFILPSAKSKNQLASLITCLIDSEAIVEVQEALASNDTHNFPGLAVSAPLSLLKKPEPEPVPEEETVEEFAYESLDHSIHGEARWVRPAVIGEWKAELRSPTTGLHLKTSLMDLSVQGCNLRCSQSCDGVLNAHVEVEFEIHGLHIQLSGVVLAIYNSRSCGVQFSPMTMRKQESLVQLVEELNVPGQNQTIPTAQPPLADPGLEKRETLPVKEDQPAEDADADKKKKKRFWGF